MVKCACGFIRSNMIKLCAWRFSRSNMRQYIYIYIVMCVVVLW